MYYLAKWVHRTYCTVASASTSASTSDTEGHIHYYWVSSQNGSFTSTCLRDELQTGHIVARTLERAV